MNTDTVIMSPVEVAALLSGFNPLEFLPETFNPSHCLPLTAFNSLGVTTYKWYIHPMPISGKDMLKLYLKAWWTVHHVKGTITGWKRMASMKLSRSMATRTSAKG